jgi:hypothetical protein
MATDLAQSFDQRPVSSPSPSKPNPFSPSSATHQQNQQQQQQQQRADSWSSVFERHPLRTLVSADLLQLVLGAVPGLMILFLIFVSSPKVFHSCDLRF